MNETLKNIRQVLVPLYGERETEAIIRIIFHHLKGWSLTDMLIHQDEVLSPFIKEEIQGILTRLEKYEPIQYITGEARFHGLEFVAKPGVLIPRPETEELVDIIIEDWKEKDDVKILDIGTGSGCIAISLARFLKFPEIEAVDISSDAIDLAKINAEKLKVKIKLQKMDILHDELHNKYDVIVSNPPYIEEEEKKDMERNVLDYEPHAALFTPLGQPLLFYKRITELASKSLRHGGRLYFEINPRFALELKKIISNHGFTDTEIIKDSFGKDRFIKALYP